VQADYGDLNKHIVAAGFPALNNSLFRIGFGISTKDERFLYNVYFGIFGINNKSVKGEEKIKSTVYDVFHVDWGYDLLRSRKVSLYPYVGLSLRSSTLRYSKPAQVNASFTNISDIIVNDQSVRTSSNKFGYHAGIGFDFTAANSKMYSGAPILFVKLGTNRPFGKETYKIEGNKYRPGILQGGWVVTLGVKFANRY
jgi:hypothetical protein